jgi:DNA helicase-2/ATP-dependent DNA helicase PcrA
MAEVQCTAMEDLLASLNPQQRAAVTAPSGQVLVLAGPGSGKTRVLTYRLAHLIRQMGIQSAHILAVTFTNKAAREMQVRVERLLGADIKGIWLGTFHGMCARILRREVNHLPVKTDFVIFDEDDQNALVKKALRELNIDEKLHRPVSVHAAISRAKNDLRLPDGLPVNSYRDEIVKRVYERYQALLISNNAVDFDDLLLYTAILMDDNPTVRAAYARRFEHILVDEFQDTNQAQYALLKSLASNHHNLFVVGDEDQSIYRWRGADYRNILRFEQDYPEATRLLLEQNYRSTQNVLDAAQSVINQNTNRTPKKLFTERGQGVKITLYEAADDHAEAAFVVDTITQLTSSGKARGGDFAIMYRTNAQSRLLEETFLRAGIPYRLVGAQRFYGRREVKDVIALMRVTHNPDDEVSLSRVINVPPRGVGEKTLGNLLAIATRHNISPGKILISLADGKKSSYWQDFAGKGQLILADFGSMLASWNAEKDNLAVPVLFDRILEDVNYQAYIDDQNEESLDRWENVMELRRIAFEYMDRSLVDFLENIALVSDQDTLPDQVNTPTLLTLHAAKGLEFPQVFITGLDDGLLPHSRSRDDPEEMAEERRLFYVGITRARDQLYLVRAEARSSFGTYESTIASSFLEQIPSEKLLYARRSMRSDSNGAYPSWQSMSQNGRPKTGETQVRKAIDPLYKAGMRVRHGVWGDGLVIDDRIVDDSEIVDVAFATVGFKRLDAVLAKLEVMKK